MRKLLSTLVAVALVGPAGGAFADDSASKAKDSGEEAVEAGNKAERAGEKAERAGEKAERAEEAQQSMGARDDETKNAHHAIGELKQADAGLTRLFDGASGYAVFPTVGKGGIGIGGAYGRGVLYERGTAIGTATLSQVTIGFQLGGQAYTEVIFFETDRSLANFKKGQFTMAAQISAVAAAEGASRNAKYVEGVSVFTLAKGGVMAEASVGGQKFSYHAFEKPVTTSSR